MRSRTRHNDRTVATVFFHDMVASTELAARLGDQRWRELLLTYKGVVRQTLRSSGGRLVDQAGDGVLAVFDQPAQALDCSGRLMDRLHLLGIEGRIGLHSGEVESIGDGVGGIAVHLGARVAAQARPGEVLLTSTVHDLVSGSAIRTVDRGVHALKGVPGEWRLFALERPDAVALDEVVLRGPGGTVGKARPWRAPATSRRLFVLAALGIATILSAGGLAGLVIHGRHGAGDATHLIPGVDTLGRIDVATRAFDASVAVGRQPIAIAVGGGGVWVANYASKTLSRLNSDGTAVVGTPNGVGATPTGIVFGDGEVWITTAYGQAGGESGSVLRFDPVSNSTAPSIDVGYGLSATAYSSGAIWVTNRNTNTVTRIDTKTSTPGTPISVGNGPEAIAMSGSDVWVANTLDSTLTHIDGRTNAEGQKIPVTRPTGVTVEAGSVWAASLSARDVVRINAQTGTIQETIPVSAGPADIVVAGGLVWVAEPDAGWVEYIDTSTDRLVDHLAVDGHPSALATDGTHVWVAIQ